MRLKVWIVSVIMGLCLLTVSLPANGATLVLNEWSNGKTFNIRVGDIVKLRLDSNPSTGYTWTNLSGTSTLKLTGKGIFPGNGMPGSGGYQYWNYKAVKPGTAVLRLVYERSWENEPPEKYFKATINVKKK